MKGHLRERSPGHWAIVIDVHDPVSGERKRRWHSFKGTKREAQRKCAELIADLEKGTHVDPTRETLAAFLGRWLDHIKPQVAPRTHERLWGDHPHVSLAGARHGTADQVATDSDQFSLRCYALERPQERLRRPLTAVSGSLPPHIVTGSAAGGSLAPVDEESVRRR
jgi:hypothetical protein